MNTPPWRTKINIHANGFRHDERALGPGFCIHTHKNRGSVPLSSNRLGPAVRLPTHTSELCQKLIIMLL